MGKTGRNGNKSRRPSFYQRFMKRFLDVVFSAFALVLLSPIMLIIAIVLKCTLKSDIIFAQYRPGRNGRPFKLYKFRSMTNRLDEDGELLPDNQRITKFGLFLRKANLDELPQLFNILKGDMSVIGPRPRLIKDMVFYDESVMEAYSIRPGLSGLSQVTGGRSKSTWEEIFEKDLEYVHNVTFINDVKIFFKTLFIIFTPKGRCGDANSSYREYYYADYLLKTGKIDKLQYEKGIGRANEIIAYMETKENSEMKLASNAVMNEETKGRAEYIEDRKSTRLNSSHL